MFISFEGADGCGKTTQAKLLVKYLNSNNVSSIYTKEPGGTSIGKKIRDIIFSTQIDSVAEMFLMLADRKMHLEKILLPTLSDGGFVVTDRFIDSTICYQGIFNKIGIDNICKIHKDFFNNLWPNITFVLDLPAKTAKQRIKYRKNNNFYDDLSEKHYETIRQGFLLISKKFSNRIHVVNADKEKILLHSEIKKILLPHIKRNVIF